MAESLDAYYTGAGEAHGEWVGGSAHRLGLTGQVHPDDLRAVLAGIRPGAGGLSPNGDTIRPHPRRVPGFDLTFKVPKSASVLYAVSDDPRVQGAVIEAGNAAMRAAIGWLEREAIRVQRGSHNLAYLAGLDPADRARAGPRRETTHGVVAASFRHRTSRSGDPFLHWHVLVANLVEGADGRWSSFAHPELFGHKRAAGEVFQAAFRAELTAALGVEWRPGRHVLEIAGIPQHLLDVFSKRSAEVEVWLAAMGMPDTPEGRQQAVLATRRHKPEVEIGSTRFDTEWKLEAEAAGWGPEHADGLIAACADRHPVDFEGAWRLETTGFDEHGHLDTWERTVDPEEWIADLLRRDLTNDRSTFTRADLTHAIAARMGPGATVDTIERLTHRVLASPHTIAVTTDSAPQQWTSAELTGVETSFIDALTRRGRTPLPTEAVTRAIQARSLGADQQHATETICASRAAVSVLIGPAGTGKTYTLDTIADAFRRAGIPVTGAAPSARAAIELQAATGVTSTTLHRWLATSRQCGEPGLLIIDEAGMADIRTLSRVIDSHLAHGGRVVLAGDHHQLPEIAAGGGLGYANRHADTIATLTVNRRQHDQWEHTALAELRDGHVARAVAAYLDHDRVTIVPTHHDLTTVAVDVWATAHSHGQNAVLLAGTNELVDQLNTAVIDWLVTTGQLPATPPIHYGDTALRPGERVVLRRNHTLDTHTADTIIPIANGQTGTITHVTPTDVTIALDIGATITLDDRYLARGGRLTHAYALTTHRSQGGTWDLAIAVGADTLTREAAYVQLSRGRSANQIILTDPDHTALLAEIDADRHDHGITPPDDQPDPIDQHLTTRFNRSAAKHLAHSLDANLDPITTLTRTATLAELEARYRHARWAEQTATNRHGTARSALVERRQRLDHIAHHIHPGLRVSPHDRNNVGTVTHIDNTTATATIHFVGRDGAHATRNFHWDQLRIVDPTPPPRSLPPSARAGLDRSLHQLDDAIARYDHTLTAHGAHPDDTHIYAAAIHHLTRQHTARLTAEQPDWLTTLIGSQPADPIGTQAWRDTVTGIARHQLRHHIPTGLGPRPTHPHLAAEWVDLHHSILTTRSWLDHTNRLTPTTPTVRTPAEQHQRLGELEAIFATAPADCRHLISELQSGQLSFDDTTELLRTASDQQDARRAWILEHWPHIVEYDELRQAVPRLSASVELDALDL